MSPRTGLSLLDVAVLEACERVGAVSRRPFRKSALVLGDVLAHTGVGQRIAYGPLCDLARRWVVHLPLIEFHGNVGSPDGFEAANPRYTECRLTPLGEAALAAERGEVGVLPIGLINGNLHADGFDAPLDPRRAIEAIRAVHEAGGVSDVEIARIVGGPVFRCGCDVEGDLAAWASGEPTELTLSARIAIEGEHRLVVSNLPPDSTVGEVAQAIAGRVGAGLPVRDVAADPKRDATRLVVTLRDGADAGSAREVLAGLWGVRRTVVAGNGTSLADAVRAAAGGDDLHARLALIEAAAS